MSKKALMSGDERTYGSTSGDNNDYGVGFAGTAPSFDAPRFYRLCDNITSNVFAITKHGELVIPEARVHFKGYGMFSLNLYLLFFRINSGKDSQNNRKRK